MLVQGVTDYAIYLLDPSGIVTDWNAGAERIKGYAAEEIVGRHFSVFYPPEQRAAGAPEKRWQPQRAKEASRRRIGGFARMAPASLLPW